MATTTTTTTREEPAYRPLEPGERALRRTCPECHERHMALLDASTGLAQCRACGYSIWFNARPSMRSGR